MLRTPGASPKLGLTTFFFCAFYCLFVADPASKSIAVLGAGITGLTAAHRLVQRGHRVRVFEQSGRTGGAIRTELTDGWLVEAGPNSLLSGDPSLTALITELGLARELVTASPVAKHRYLVRRGRAVAAPLSPPAFLRSPLFSLNAKVRVLVELLSSRRVRTADLSLEDFICSHFGQEIVDYALNPFVSGVYAGNPRKLSARYAFPRLWELEQRHGSLLRGLRALAQARHARQEPDPAIISFTHGLQTLPSSLASRLPAGSLVFGARLDRLVPGPQWNVIWNDDAGPRTETFDAVIAALPAPALAALRLGPLTGRPLAGLAAIEHPPVASLFLGYRRDQVAHPLDGFGLLVPALEQRQILGVLFSSSLFAGRAPAGHVALTVMVGGARQPELAALSPDRLLAAVRPDLTGLLGVTGEPVILRHTFWPKAIPQYNLGHEQHLETMAAAERAHPGLFIGGQTRHGISLPACIAAGESLANRAAPVL
jgi:oxygen-dependent protoporphyrinogen oxidase